MAEPTSHKVVEVRQGESQADAVTGRAPFIVVRLQD
jgi:hypothetical protein